MTLRRRIHPERRAMTLTATRTYSPCGRDVRAPTGHRTVIVTATRKYHPGLLGPDKHLTSPEMSLPCSDETRARYGRVSQSSGREQRAVAAHGGRNDPDVVFNGAASRI